MISEAVAKEQYIEAHKLVGTSSNFRHHQSVAISILTNDLSGLFFIV